MCESSDRNLMSEPASGKMFQTSPLPRQPQVPTQRRDGGGSHQISARLCASAGGLRPGGRPDDVMSDLSAARTATRSGQCRESRARRTHEFARSAGRAARQEPTTPDCQTQHYADIQRTAKLSFNLSKFRLLWQTTHFPRQIGRRPREPARRFCAQARRFCASARPFNLSAFQLSTAPGSAPSHC